MKSLTVTTLALTVLFVWSDGLAQTSQKEKKKQAAKTVHLSVDWSISCEDCHVKETPKAVKEWQFGKHGEVNVGCFVCHGDGVEEYHPQPSTERCIGCHPRQEADMQGRAEPSCFSCHHGHTLKFHD
ncbi:MAG: hypothetical protein WEE20_09010 [Bacteroidota bacterium]